MYHTLDVRMTLEDFCAKLALHHAGCATADKQKTDGP